jgi:hypothetical protein
MRLRYRDQMMPVERILRGAMAQRFGFVSLPAP